MVPAYRLQKVENAMLRLDKILSGAEVTNLTLPEALKTGIDNNRQALADNVENYALARREHALTALSLRAMQNETLLLLRRARQFVGSHLSLPERDAMRKQYGLATLHRFGQERMLQILTNVIAVSASQTDPALKLPADMVTSAQTLQQAFHHALDNKRHYFAGKISLRQSRVDVIREFRKVRNQVYAFLMQVMPEGSRDPRLTDFGFRPSVLRRKAKASAMVTMASEFENNGKGFNAGFTENAEFSREKSMQVILQEQN